MELIGLELERVIFIIQGCVKALIMGQKSKPSLSWKK